ncbi:MAG: hypothetical protein K2J40_03740 [Ruminococcus sp.]|nr:hypothetical protein [Ruminococcus sp.]
MKNKLLAGILSATIMCGSVPCFNGNTNAAEEYETLLQFDVNGDGFADAVDASLILSAYSYMSTGSDYSFESFDEDKADVNKDGAVNSIDASIILKLYSFLSTGYDYQKTISLISDYISHSNIIADFSDEEIKNSKYKPTITIDCVSLSLEEALISGTVSVDIRIRSAEQAYCSTGLHVKWDPSLILNTTSTGRPDVQTGDAIEYLKGDYENNDNGIFLATAGSDDYGLDGTMWTLNFKLPEDIRGGEEFPIEIEYDSNDIFTNLQNNEEGQLMQAYAFTRGICGGFIKIELPSATTTATTTTKTTTATTTTATTTATTTTATNIAPKLSGDANGDDKISLADAVIIMQSLSNPDDYKLSEQAIANADIVDNGNGITPADALAIQLIDLKKLSVSDLPITSEKMNSLLD